MGRRRRSRRQRGAARTGREPQPSFLQHLGNHRAAPYLCVVLLTVLLYANTLTNEFVSDAAAIIPNHPLITQPSNIVSIFTSGYRPGGDTGLYRPFTVWTFALNHAFNNQAGFVPFNPIGFHFVDLLLHAVVGCILYRFLAVVDLPRWPRLTTVLLFLVNPIHTEAVDSVVGRADMLAAIFGLLFLLWHRTQRHLLLPAAAYLMALWSKESAIAFIALAVILDVLFPQLPLRRHFLPYTVYGFTASLWLSLRSTATSGSSASAFDSFLDNPLLEASLYERIFTAGHVNFDYLRLQLIPVGLSSDYSYNQIPTIGTPTDPRFVAFLLILVVALLVGWRQRRTHPIVAVSVLGYGALSSPTSNILFPIGTIMAERLVYVPSIFSCLLLAYGLWRLSERYRWLGICTLIVLLTTYSGLTVERNRDWATTETFYKAQLHSAPQSAKSHYNMGTILQNRREYGSALEHYRRAIKIYPDAADPYYNIGNILRHQGGDPERIADSYRQATEKDSRYSSYWSAHVNLAATLLSMDKTEEARSVLHRLSSQEPPNPKLPLLYLQLAAADSGSTVSVPKMNEGISSYTRQDFAAAAPNLKIALQTEDLPVDVQYALRRMLDYALKVDGELE